MTVPYIFRAQSGRVPASELDDDFAYVVANAVFTPKAPTFITGDATVGVEAHNSGIVKTGSDDSIITWSAAMAAGTFIPWWRNGSGTMVFAVAGAGTIEVEMAGYDRAWLNGSAGFAWCTSNADGNSPVVVMSGDMAGPV